MNKLVSIIIPVYNVEKYVKKCAISLVEQTYKKCEFIFVNDGTKDNSIEIVRKLKDSRIKIINQKNSGVSEARNNGLKNAKGEYIVFVDADDYLAKDFVEYMVNLIESNDADFAYSIDNFKSKKDKQNENLFVKNIDSTYSSGLLLSPDVTVGCWNKIYRRKTIIENNMSFSKELFYGEGLHFIIRMSLVSKNIVIGNKKVYYYRKNNVNSATTKFNIEKYYNGINSLNKIKDFVDMSDKYVKSMYILHISTFYLGAITKIIEYKKEKKYKDTYKNWKKQLRKNLIYILKNKHISFYRKIMLLMGSLFPKIIAKMNIKRSKKIIENSV